MHLQPKSLLTLADGGIAAALGIGSALSGLFGSILNAKSQNNANRINQQNFRESMDFQKYQYEDAKSWQGAVAQVNRLRAAGLNPLLAMSNLATSAPVVSSPSANPQEGVDYASALGSASELGSMLTGASLQPSQEAMNYGSAAKSTADSVGQNIENQFKGQLSQRSLEKLGYEADTAGYLASLNRETLGSSIRQSWLTTQRMELLNEYQGLLNTSQMILNGFMPNQTWAQIQNVLADTTLKLAKKQIGYMNARANIKNAVANARNSMKSAGIYMSDEQAEKLANTYIDKVSSESFKNYSFEDKVTPYSSKRRAQFNPHTREWHEQYLSD